MTDSWVRRAPGSPYLTFSCACGWEGPDAAVTEWAVQHDRDRVVRRCPDCDRPVPEWGTFGPIDGLAPIAHGELQAALEGS